MLYFISHPQHVYKKISHIIIHSSNSQINLQKQVVNTVPPPPKIKNIIDWRKNSLSKIQEMMSLIKIKNTQNIHSLLVNTIENYSNHILDIHQTTENLISLLHELNNNQFIIIDSNVLYKIYNNIKLSNKNLTSRGINIKLGRYTHAEYILYSTIYNHLENIHITLELILVNNGEIIWSDTTYLQQ